MTPTFISRSIIVFNLIVGMSISTSAETVKMMHGASPDGFFTLAQTGGTPGRTAVSRKGPLVWTSATANREDASKGIISRGAAAGEMGGRKRFHKSIALERR